MAQSSNLGAVDTGTGATVRAGFNAGFRAAASDNEGSSSPAPTYPFMPWRNAAAGQLKRRNAGNSGWEITENYGASTDPSAGDDATVGYIRGSLWINTAAPRMWWCLDPSPPAPRWLQLGMPAWRSTQVLSVAASNTISPVALASWTVPANTFAITGDCLDFELIGEWMNNTGSNRATTLRLLIGAVAIIADASAGLATGTDPRLYRIAGRLWRHSSAAVKAWLTFGVWPSGAGAGAGRGDLATAMLIQDRLVASVAAGAAADWTVNQTFSIDWAMSVASPSLSVTAEYFKAAMLG